MTQKEYNEKRDQRVCVVSFDRETLKTMNINPTSTFSYICILCIKGIDGDVEGVSNYPEETGLPLHDECHEFLVKHPNYRWDN
jgi:hypothetical protein